MASLDYVPVPPAASRLRAPPAHDIRPAAIAHTPLPASAQPAQPARTASTPASAGLLSPTLTLLPQLLANSAPPQPTSSPTTLPAASLTPRLLSNKDPLSLPTTSANFRRFVARVGPLFWLQDRLEEVIMWRRGWRITVSWMAAYAFLCYFPRTALLLPHLLLIGAILASYPYPNHHPPSQEPADTPGTAAWQANLQAIQNLMGFVADTHDRIQPYVHHLALSSSHFPNPPSAQPSSSHPPLSPYPPYILAFLLVSLLPLLLVLVHPLFPMRATCLALGFAPFAASHPATRRAWPVLPPALAKATAVGAKAFLRARGRVEASGWRWRSVLAAKGDGEGSSNISMLTALEHVIDDDRLSDTCWRAEMREVELWENERFVLVPGAGAGMGHRSGSADAAMEDPSHTGDTTAAVHRPQIGISHTETRHGDDKGWSKLNLRPGERGAWTRRRDGWGGVGAGAGGEVSSNLTFSLAPGWAFVTSEGWRRDRAATWASAGQADGDGWVYTNDAWGEPVAVTGSVTRRRRWMRRIWYDPLLAAAS